MALALLRLPLHLQLESKNVFACQIVAKDFSKPAAGRALFLTVDPDTTPKTAEGARAIDATIASLYTQLTGAGEANSEQFSQDLADATSVFQAGYQNARNAQDSTLPEGCRQPGITDDKNFTIHGWMAVVAYILSAPEMVMR